MGKPRIYLRPTSMLRKQAGQMRKMLGLWNKPEIATSSITEKILKKTAPPVVKDGRPTFLTQTEGIRQEHITRRQLVLNRHFTEIISDVLAVNLKRQLIDIGVSITSIETKAWNKGISVFYSTNKPFDMKIHQELDSLVAQLKAAITERRLIGRTPNISFVYDDVIEMDRNLQLCLNNVNNDTINNDKETSDVVKTSTSTKIWPTKGLGANSSKLIANQFSAPDDMSNMMLGLDYVSLYDNVVGKLEQGRGESSRMIPTKSIASTAKPLFRMPLEGVGEEDDPVRRLLKMQKFLVSQRKKTERHAKERRQEELLARDCYKWDLPDEDCDEAAMADNTRRTEELDLSELDKDVSDGSTCKDGL